ncbi:MAG: dTDP-4-dehydrorhamnose 3,5-epimerase [Gammaproteobacteria bacterium]|nr:dTDP-4-dehydrorhamnose 3,5-epimerase [Gammaproteobacteria bacterium]
MEVIDTGLAGLLLIKPKAFGDSRGYFMESYQEQRYQDAGITTHFVQDNVSRSQKGVLRGLHFQTEHAQDKLVMVSRGQVFDVAVDIRTGSPTFGQSYGVILNDQNHWQLYVPKGFAHGFYVMENDTDFCYKCSDYYHPEFETGILWSDPDLKIDWPLDPNITPIISTKDQLLPQLKDFIL